MASKTSQTSGRKSAAPKSRTVEKKSPTAAKNQFSIGAKVSMGWLLLMVFAGIASRFSTLGLPDPYESSQELAGAGPSWGHPFGGDSAARDLFARVVAGTGNTLIIAVGGITIGLLIGGFFGLVSGYFGGWVDKVLSTIFDIFLAFPAIVLAIALVSVFADQNDTTPARRLVVLTLALGAVSIPLLARITRANTMAWADREFVLAAKALGAKWYRVLFMDVLPNVIPAMLSIAFLGVGIGIVAEAGLAVVGVGVQLPEPSWGNVMAEHAARMRTIPWGVFGPVIFIFLTVLALNTVGDAIQRRFDVRESLL